MDFLITFLPKIENLGLFVYWLIFGICVLESTAVIGLVVPGTTILVFFGFLASQQAVDLGDVIWVAALGGIIGDAISFYLGKRGISLFRSERRFLNIGHLEKGKIFFNNHGDKSVFLARFIGPIRPIIPFVAGLCAMNRKKFFLLNIIGGFASAIVFSLLGYFFGQAWGKAEVWFGRIEAGAVIAIAVVLAGYGIRKMLFKKA